MKLLVFAVLFLFFMKDSIAAYSMPKNIDSSYSKNGMFVATDSMKNIDSVTVQVCFKIGSRYESSELNGMSHFLEHMAFKGTKNRTAKQIAEEIEAVGGFTNAFTSKENTCYYIKVLKKDVELAFDILSDILLNSSYDEGEIEKERGVILQEIAMYEDNPQAVASEEFDLQAFGNTKVGQKIIGTRANVKRFTSDDFRKFKEENYKTSNSSVFVVGNITHRDAIDLTNKYFAGLDSGKPELKIDEAKYVGGKIVRTKPNLEQVQFLLGFKTPSYTKDIKKSFALEIASIIFGGGMSSRLFQEIREKKGLVYHISSGTDYLKDTGMFEIYAATSKEDVDKMSELVLFEIEKFKHDGITDVEMSKALNRFKSSTLMSMESPNGRLSKLSGNFFIHNRYITREEILDIVMSITKDDVMNAFNEIVDIKTASLVVYGSDLDQKNTCKVLFS